MPERRTQGEYRAAQLAARAAVQELSAQSVRSVQASIEDMARRLERRVRRLTGTNEQKALEAQLAVYRLVTVQLMPALVATVATGRAASFAEVYAIWVAALEAVAGREDIPAALMGAIRAPALTMAGAYERLGGAAATWRTLLPKYARDGAAEADAVVREAILSGAGVEDLARSLRRYVLGADAMEAFAGESYAAVRRRWHSLPPETRGALRRMTHNATRIAFSEIHNARAEAELTHFAVDPLVSHVRWTLSPFRGKVDAPDECDVYAGQDWFGLGAGMWPLDKVPPPPHPFDRCERMPVLFPVGERAAKPTPAMRERGPVTFKVRTTAEEKTRVVRRARALAAQAALGEPAARMRALLRSAVGEP